MLVGNYFYNYALNAKQEKEFLQDNPHLVETVNASGDVLVQMKKRMQTSYRSINLTH